MLSKWFRSIARCAGRDFAGGLGAFCKRARVGLLEWLPVWLLVTFPAYQMVAFEPDAEAALLGRAVARLVIIRVVPAIAAEDVLQCGRAQEEAYLLASHSGLQACDLFGREPVALLNVRTIREAPLGAAAGR